MFALSWASYREFQVFLREAGGSAESDGVPAAVDPEEAGTRGEERYDSHAMMRDVEEDGGDGDDEGDYYGAENVDGRVEQGGSGGVI